MKTKINQSLTAIFLIMLLSGCLPPPPPTVFGVPQDQWNVLTKQQQNEVIRGYNRRQQQAEANAPYVAAIGAANALASQAMSDQRARENQQAYEKMGFHTAPPF